MRVALLGLFVQLALPGLHAHEAHGHSGDCHAARAVTSVAAMHDQGAQHDPATCPLCRAIAAGWALSTLTPGFAAVPTRAVVDAPRILRSIPVRLPDLTTETPRGPPALLVG
jgi:hypothetical protein